MSHSFIPSYEIIFL